MSRKKHDCAIVGMACIYPESENIREYWNLILNQVDTIKEVPSSRWNVADYFGDTALDQDRTYSKRGGFIPDIKFDPVEFGLPPNILEVTDVSQLLSIKVAKQALDDAGYDLSAATESVQDNVRKLDRTRTGVILGGGGLRPLAYSYISRLQYPIWKQVLRTFDLPEDDINRIVQKLHTSYIDWQESSFPGYLGNVIAGRVANRLNLGGINCMVDAACASSLAAMNLAVSELSSGRNDLVITGGVDLDNSPMRYLSFSHTGAFSRKGDMRPFDIDSDGMLSSEGIGMMVVKRLADAEKEGDRIYAVVKGVGASSDGKSKSIYAPAYEGQRLAIQNAYRNASVPVEHVQLIEAHGTGTAAGDLSEITALCDAMPDLEKNSIALGSVKSQIGHTKAAAGAAGLIKTALSLHHKILPPTIKISKPNPKLGIDDTPFYLNTLARPWFSRNGIPRTAGVSAFGFGGTNYHVVLQEYAKSNPDFVRVHDVPVSIVLAEESKSELLNACGQLLEALRGEAGYRTYREAAAVSSALNINPEYPRIGFVAESLPDAIKKLEIASAMLQNPEGLSSHPAGVYFQPRNPFPEGKLVVLFSGQGSQFLNMGRDVVNNFPELQDSFVQMDSLFQETGDTKLSDVVYPVPLQNNNQQEEKRLASSRYNGPSLAAFSAGLYRLLSNNGLKADIFFGHSFGEVIALWAAGVLNDRDFRFLAKKRAELTAPQQTDKDYGAMLAVSGDIQNHYEGITGLSGVSLANFNSPRQIVVGVPVVSVEEISASISDMGLTVTRLPVEVAFHTHFIQHSVEPFRNAVNSVRFNSPRCPIYTNSTGGLYPQSMPENLVNQLMSPVLFKKGLEKIYDDGGRIFLEIAPRVILTNFVRDTLEGRPHFAIAVNYSRNKNSDYQLRDAIIQLRVNGVNLSDFDNHMDKREIAAVTYSSCTVDLNGGGYVSDKSRRKISDALTDKETLSISGYSDKNSIFGDTKKDNAGISTSPNPLNVLNDELIAVNKHHVDTLVTHQQYLSLQRDYLEAISSLTNDLERIKKDSFLADDIDERRVFDQPFSSRNASVLPDKTEQAGSDVFKPVEQVLLGIVSDKTGYPPEMLELDMDLEADLGVDSIKKVEIISALLSDLGIGQESNVNSNIEARSLKDIINAFSGFVSTAPVKTPTEKTADGKQVAAFSAGESDSDAVCEALLAVVSEKTGYPRDMLELEMNIEADLGIDSIKKVEIFGALAEKLHWIDMEVDSNAAAGLETLGDVVNFVVGKTAQQVTHQTKPAHTQQIPLQPEMPQVSTQPYADTRPDSRDSRVILLDVISEKTGYPVEMLDTSMDLEADLGIDSIKKVEILSVMQEEMSMEIPVDGSSPAELNTIDQILAYFQKLGKGPETTVANQGDAGWDKLPESGKNELSGLIECFPVKLSMLSVPEQRNLNISSQPLLVISDGSELTQVLVKRLEDLGFIPVLITLFCEGSPSAKDVDFPCHHESLDSVDEESITRLVESVLVRYGDIGGLIYLHPAFESADPIEFIPREKVLLEAVFLFAKKLVPMLATGNTPARKCFFISLRHDGKLGYGGDGDNYSGVVAGGFNGLMKSLHIEYPHVLCRLVDNHYALPVSAIADNISAEVFDNETDLVEVGCHRDGRFTLAVDESYTDNKLPESDSGQYAINKDTVFLVSGGGRGITSRCVVELARRYQCRFILVGRSTSDEPVPDWFTDRETEAQIKKKIVEYYFAGKRATPKQLESRYVSLLRAFEVNNTLSAIKRFGGEAVYLSVGIDDPGFSASLKPIIGRFGRIDGIVHGAGIIDDSLINKKTLASFRSVMQVKVDGLQALLSSVSPHELRFLALFSSTAGFFGNRGQTDYAAANEVLNRTAARFNRVYPQCRVISYNWGPWDSGMVSTELKKLYASKKIPLIPLEYGVRLFADLLGSRSGYFQYVIGKYRKSYITGSDEDAEKSKKHSVSMRLGEESNPFLQDHSIDSIPVLPATCAAAWMIRVCETLFPGYTFYGYSKFKVLKGIIFNESFSGKYELEVDELVCDDSRVVCGVMVKSRQSDKPYYHYSCKVELRSVLPITPHINFTMPADSGIKAGKQYYQRHVLFHGKSFRGVDRVLAMSEDEIVVECSCKPVSLDVQGDFRVSTFNPFISDVAGHGILIWAYEYKGAGCLPAYLEEYRQYKSIAFGERFYVNIKIKSCDNARLIADITAHDSMGCVYFQRIGSEMTVNKELLEKYKNNRSDVSKEYLVASK